MGKKQKEINIVYQLVDFELESHVPLSEDNEPKDYGYSVQINNSKDLEDNTIYIKISIDAQSGPKSKPFFKASTLATFNIKDLSKFYDELPSEFIANLIAISYSTTRGYLLALNKGNFLEHSPIPLINMKNILAEISKESKKKDSNKK